MKTISLLALGAVCLLPSCATLNETGRAVQVVDYQPPRSTFVGRVSTMTPGSELAQYASYDDALKKALNQAGEMGATHLVLDKDSKPRFFGLRQEVRGNAYRGE
ncbi:MAG: hypothetical protein EOP83_22990 [Verrucomicrobiaceae bacterium]|nr:MAG: hypothetical protein EOP83_22990 [Verrucomicrobiaceae bacterium]